VSYTVRQPLFRLDRGARRGGAICLCSSVVNLFILNDHCFHDQMSETRMSMAVVSTNEPAYIGMTRNRTLQCNSIRSTREHGRGENKRSMDGSSIMNRNLSNSTNNTTPSSVVSAAGAHAIDFPMSSVATAAAPTCRYAFPHEHAQPRGRFEYVINALDSQRRALLVGASANGSRYALSFGTRYKSRGVSIWRCWPQVSLAPDEKDGDCRATYIADFVYPLKKKT